MTETQLRQVGDDEHSGEAQHVDAPRLLLHGLDSLYVCYYLELVTSNLDFEDLEYRKQLVKDGQQGQEFLELGSERFMLKAYGQKPYRYVLENEAFSVALGENMSPSLKVQFYSAALWRDGAMALHGRIHAWAESMGAHRNRPEVVSRADWAFDFNLPAIDFDENHFASRARKDAKYRESGAPQTFVFGTDQTVVRVYDKVAEIEQASGKAWFYDLWGQRKDVWRVEFQVRGDRLKQGGIRTMEDLEALQGDLLRELASNHTTLRVPSPDSNRSRWPFHPLWQALFAAVAALPQLGLSRSYDPANLIEYRLAVQVRSLYGSLKALGALLALQAGQSGEQVSLDRLTARLPRLLDRHHSEVHWAAEIEDRIRKHEMGQW